MRFCWHNYSIIKVFPYIRVYKRCGKTMSENERTAITVEKCAKCGKLKTTFHLETAVMPAGCLEKYIRWKNGE